MAKDQQALWRPTHKVLGYDALWESATDRHRPTYNGLEILNRLRERGYKPGPRADHPAHKNSEPEDWQLPSEP